MTADRAAALTAAAERVGVALDGPEHIRIHLGPFRAQGVMFPDGRAMTFDSELFLVARESMLVASNDCSAFPRREIAMTFTTALGLQKLVEEAKKTGIVPEGVALAPDVKKRHRLKTFKQVPIVVDPSLPPGTMELRGAHQTRVRIEGIDTKGK